MDKTIVFVSHPYTGNPTLNKEKADAICKRLTRQGYFPISPLHLFSFKDDDADRELIMSVCFHLIDICDEVWICGDSEGCREEMQYALSKGKKVRIMY